MKSSIDIGNDLDQREKEKQALLPIIAELEQEILSLRYEVDKIRVKIREKDMFLVKAKFNARKVDMEIKILTRAFWTAKNSGI